MWEIWTPAPPGRSLHTRPPARSSFSAISASRPTTGAILCADHAVTSLVQLSLEAEFTRGHGALYDALAGGRIDEEALAALLTGTLPLPAGGEQERAWIGRHDVIDDGLLESALAGLPGEDAAAVRQACARWRRLRFAIDATPYPRPDAECSPGREHVHHELQPVACGRRAG